MKWIAISGAWRKINKEIEIKVKRYVKEIIFKGDGIVSGGALGVDYVATEEALKLNPKANRIKIFLPTTLEVYAAHYRKRAKEGVITKKQAEKLIFQLEKIKKLNPASIIENKENKKVNEKVYHERISLIIDAADELIAFHVNKTLGVGESIKKAKEKGIPVKVFKYNIK